MTDAFDVAVIGAGPAGASVAYHLARRGRRVIMFERARFPRDKACGDGLGRRSVSLVEAMGLRAALGPYRRIKGVRLVGPARDTLMPYPVTDAMCGHGAIVPRRDLDHMLARAAQDAGATLWQEARVVRPVLTDGVVTAVVVVRDGIEHVVPARFAVAADGALSSFARMLGIDDGRRAGIGYAVRAYFENVEHVGDTFDVHVPLLDPDTRRTLTGYGWTFPVTDGHLNVGVGHFSARAGDGGVNLRRTFEHFVARLRETDRRLRDMRMVHRPIGAPVPSAVDLGRCAARGTLLVGDAAGLVDPLTGEGIATALESGELAADVLDRALGRDTPRPSVVDDYARAVVAHFGRRFETSRRLVGMSGFLWRVIENTSDLDTPVVRRFRRALVSEDVEPHAGVVAVADDPWLRAHDAAAHAARARARLRTELDRQYPLLSRVCDAEHEGLDRAVRLQLLFVTAHFGTPEVGRLAIASAAIELAQLALAMHDEVLNGSHDGGGPSASAGRWSNIFTVSAGDHLLSRAHALAAELGSDVTAIVSRASARAYLGRAWDAMAECRTSRAAPSRLAIVDAKVATLFSLACRVGARLGGAPDAVVDTLGRYGRHVGLALALVDNDRDAATDRAGSAASRAVPGARRLACRHATLARRRLTTLPAIDARRVLAALVDVVVASDRPAANGR